MKTEHSHDHSHDRRAVIAEYLKAALLIGLGVYFAAVIASGSLTNYINARLSWLSYVAAALFLLIGVFSLVHLLTARPVHHDHDHDHAPISWGTLIVIAVPLVLGTLIPSRPLGAESVDGAVSITAASVDNMVMAIEPLKRNVLDWLRVFAAASDPAALSGQPADVIGFVYLEPTLAEQQFMLARFTMSCCVADASAIGMPVVWGGDVRQGEWVRVTGTIQTGEFRGAAAPILRADAVEVVAQPEHPYLYP
jgi:uncharacterized repeat protein (TIGR03943 family)